MYTYFETKDSGYQNLCARAFHTQDGHGGRAELHRSEMEEIARRIIAEERERLMEEINERILQAQYRAYEQALQDVMRVLEYDVESVTKIGIDGCRDIFESKKAQKFISDQLCKAITKELKGKHFRP